MLEPCARCVRVWGCSQGLEMEATAEGQGCLTEWNTSIQDPQHPPLSPNHPSPHIHEPSHAPLCPTVLFFFFFFGSSSTSALSYTPLTHPPTHHPPPTLLLASFSS